MNPELRHENFRKASSRSSRSAPSRLPPAPAGAAERPRQLAETPDRFASPPGSREIQLRSRLYPRCALVRAAFLPAAARPAEPFVRAAFRAAAERSAALRCDAACVAWRDRAACDAVFFGSRLRTLDTARDTRGRRVGLRSFWPTS